MEAYIMHNIGLKPYPYLSPYYHIYVPPFPPSFLPNYYCKSDKSKVKGQIRVNMAPKAGVTRRKNSSNQENSDHVTDNAPNSPQTQTKSRKQMKAANKQKKITKLAAQELVQSRIRNKMFIAVIFYVVIGGGAFYWYGLPQPKDLPPEAEMEILDSFPHELKKEDLPKTYFQDEKPALSIGQEKKENIDNNHSGPSSEENPDLEREEKKKIKEKQGNAAGGIGAEAVEMFPDFESNIQNKFRLKSKDGIRWKKMKLLKNNSTSKVQIYVIDNFLSEMECNGLMRAHLRHLQYHSENDPITCFSGLRSLRKHMEEHGMKKMAPKMTEKDFIPGTLCLNKTLSAKVGKKLPWSYSTAFYPGESKFSAEFDERVFKHTGLDPRNGGKFQVTSYPEGVGYKGHHDCTVDNVDKRDRFGTILIYLQDVKEGGDTVFPDLGVSVRPKKGRALLWNNMDPEGNCDPSSFHKAGSVLKGKKYILQRWYYYQNFPMLGKRSPQPPLPERNENTARVSCDQYQFGSCRWYDEWTYDHITSYEAVKHTLL